MARKWWVALALALLVAGGVAGGWTVATRRMEAELLGWAEARRVEGWQVSHAPPERVGFPIRPGLRLRDLDLALPLGLGWRAASATLDWRPTDWRHLHLALDGPQGLRVPGGVVPIVAASLGGRAALDGSATALDGEAVRIGGSDLGRLSLRWRPGGFDLAADALRLAELGGLRLDGLNLAGRMQPPPTGTARQWRDANGALTVERLELRQGPTVANLAGALALDARLQPEGRGQLQLVAPGEAVRALAEAGLVPQQVAGPLRAIIGFGARVPPEGGPPRLDIPWELRERRLTTGRLPVATLPEMEWR
jgi:hypothetical protein